MEKTNYNPLLSRVTPFVSEATPAAEDSEVIGPSTAALAMAETRVQAAKLIRCGEHLINVGQALLAALPPRPDGR